MTADYDSLNLSVRTARGRLLRAALSCVSSDIDEEPHAHSDAQAEYCDDGLAYAARDYVKALDAARKDNQQS